MHLSQATEELSYHTLNMVWENTKTSSLRATVPESYSCMYAEMYPRDLLEECHMSAVFNMKLLSLLLVCVLLCNVAHAKGMNLKMPVMIRSTTVQSFIYRHVLCVDGPRVYTGEHYTGFRYNQES